MSEAYEKVGDTRLWVFGGTCRCGGTSNRIVLLPDSRGVLLWHRACETCAPIRAEMAKLDNVVNG